MPVGAAVVDERPRGDTARLQPEIDAMRLDRYVGHTVTEPELRSRYIITLNVRSDQIPERALRSVQPMRLPYLAA